MEKIFIVTKTTPRNSRASDTIMCTIYKIFIFILFAKISGDS